MFLCFITSQEQKYSSIILISVGRKMVLHTLDLLERASIPVLSLGYFRQAHMPKECKVSFKPWRTLLEKNRVTFRRNRLGKQNNHNK